MRLRDIMTRDVVSVSPDVSLQDAMALFSTKHVSGAPVISNGRVLGVVSATDLMSFASSLPGVPTFRDEQAAWGDFEEPTEWAEGDESPSAYFTTMWEDAGADAVDRVETTEGPEWNMLEEHTVAEAMTQVVNSLPPDTDVARAAEYMQRASIHRVLVMQRGELLGIATTSDLARALASSEAHD
jgi:CBS domain-containing protein